MQSKFYITTPIYYVNDLPHIGHAYTTIAADVLARYKRMAGYTVFFLTGTDEHGLKVEQAARDVGETPLQLANRVVKRFQTLWNELNISHDDFIRTTEPRHAETVCRFFQKIEANGDIYIGSYEDWYCVPCESFWTEMQLENGTCPDCHRPVEKVREESYFFRLSRYQEPLLAYYRENPEFIQPASRYNEIVNFVRQGLRDLSISRTSFSWGIPVPGTSHHIFYVWFDALLNYISALDYSTGGERFTTLWPADVHIIGKDIVRFHAVYWPAFLMSAGLPLPRKVFAHGWWTIEGKKMSKSLGNVVDPLYLSRQYGVDALRYFLLREVPFGLDGDYSHNAIIGRINSDLANDLGNLLSRTIGMLHKYHGGTLKETSTGGGRETMLRQHIAKVVKDVDAALEELAFHRALFSIWEYIGMVNKYIDESAPWILVKDRTKEHELATVLAHCVVALRKIAVLIAPFMPNSAQTMWQALAGEGSIFEQKMQDVVLWDSMPQGTRIEKIPALFPRIQNDGGV
ncbi:MAG: methionine--tRNA ligase [Desulfobacterota bacterium]|nr:methionine--tRNA ligase [Thermodesulfobacteriota bacterium]